VIEGRVVVSWTDLLGDDPLPWLLEDPDPAVRAAALVRLLGRPVDDSDVVAALDADPLRAILAAQDPEGFWVKPGAGYSPKYQGTVWQLIFLDQLGADPDDGRIGRACDYVLSHSPAATGGMGAASTRADAAPPPSSVIHCLNGNLLRALLGFGRGDDPRVAAAIDWAARAITGQDMPRWYASGTSGPGFACGANEGQPCAWGAVKELLALARVPRSGRGPLVERAVTEGVEFLLARDPAVADYPFPSYATKPSGAWFSLGFPIAYVTDVLQNLEALAELGHVRDPRARHALEWLLTQQVVPGRWRNRHAYNGKTTVDIERQGSTSKWVTLRACTVLRAAYG
jgi:hypothetical protein